MSWECKTVSEQREEFVSVALNTGNFSEVCREYGITRKTGYKWLKRYEEGKPMSDKSKAPLHIANKTPPDMEKAVLNIRADNPGWGAKTIHRVLENNGYDNLPCVKTINNILNRNGCIDSVESDKRKPYIRFAKEHSNDMWQTDFKGEFKMNNGKYCYPLDIIDDSTRFAIKIAPFESTANVVISSFEAAFREYGMPEAVLSDNGAQFAGFRHGFTQFEKFLMNHEWRCKYNCIRPHEALNMLCPAEVYEKSKKEYTEEVPEYIYSGENHVIKVNTWGYVRFAHYQVYISETMINEQIEFRHSSDGNSFYACYRNFKIAEFDVQTGKLLNRQISRL